MILWCKKMCVITKNNANLKKRYFKHCRVWLFGLGSFFSIRQTLFINLLYGSHYAELKFFCSRLDFAALQNWFNVNSKNENDEWRIKTTEHYVNFISKPQKWEKDTGGRKMWFFFEFHRHQKVGKHFHSVWFSALLRGII